LRPRRQRSKPPDRRARYGFQATRREHTTPLRNWIFSAAHGHGIAKAIERTSEEALRVDHGSLYPALQRLQQEGWITAEWGTSKNNRWAKYYRLTAAGRRQLAAETSRWERFVRAITGVLRPAESEEGQ
jgi:PadR family transcriptional regulator, regulatory protein PadR